MQLTLVIIVFITSIVVFFSKEFLGVLKRIFEIKGAKLFIPLIAASFIVEAGSIWFLWFMYYVHLSLHSILVMWMSLFHKHQFFWVALGKILVLTLVSVVPVYIIDRQKRKKSFEGYAYPYTTSSIVLIVSALLLL